MKVNLLSPDIYEIEDFVTIQEQEEILNVNERNKIFIQLNFDCVT